MRHNRVIQWFALGTLGVSLAWGGSLNFSGSFAKDDDIQVFTYRVQNTGVVNVFTTSFATGGFSPVLSLFDATGGFQFFDSGYANNTEASLSWNSIGGSSYLIVLTQYDNFPIGNLADGFTEQGNGNFTAIPPFNNPGFGTSFLLPGPEQRTGQWAVTIQSDDPTLTGGMVPEPASAWLVVVGVAGLLCRRSKF